MRSALPALQHGIAIVTAMLVVALATTAAVAMTLRQQLDIRRTANLLQAEQAAVYLQAVEDWSAWVLLRDSRNGNVDSLGDQWATLLPPVPIENGQLAGRIIDLQSRFNLNNLVQGNDVSAADVAVFRRLLAHLQLDPELVSAVIDWMDADINYSLPAGAEDEAYLVNEPPYRAANRPMASVSELRLVAGVDAEVYRTLRPYVTVLPQPSRININTAPAEVVLAIAEGLEPSEVARFIDDRGTKGYTSVAEALRHSAFAGRQIDERLLSVNSQWFMVMAELEVGRIYRKGYSVLLRGSSGSTNTVMRTYSLD